MFESFAGAEGGTLALLALGLAIAFGFEFVNGFHDTANAVATVIYTRSLRPVPAVVWSGIWNAVGVLHAAATGLLVAFSIVHLLPVDLLVSLGPGAGLAMVFSLLRLAPHPARQPLPRGRALPGLARGPGLALARFG